MQNEFKEISYNSVDERYYIGEYSLTSGTVIEVYIRGELITTSVEHKNNSYYLVGYENTNPIGLKARVKR